jgi:predicted permease
LLPIAIGLAAGFTLRRIRLLDQRDGEGLFKLVFYLFTPAVTFNSLSTVDLQPRFALYPAAAIAIIAAGYAAARITAARARLDPVQTAVVISGCMVVNTAFQLPFVQLLYGADGVARIAAFDIVNTTATFTLSYLVAIRGNPAHAGGPVRLDRLVKNPALYAIAAGLLVNLAGISVPSVIAAAIAKVGAVVAVVIPVGIGIIFNPVGCGLGRALLMIAVRLTTGLLVAAAIVSLLGLSGVDRTVLLLIGVAPLVFAVVTFASLENLDLRLATNAVSLSLPVSFVFSVLIVLVTA